jgi:hypothetical protein
MLAGRLAVVSAHPYAKRTLLRVQDSPLLAETPTMQRHAAKTAEKLASRRVGSTLSSS